MKRALILIGCVALVAVIAVASTSAARSAVPAGLVGTWGKPITTATWHKHYVYVEQGGHWSIVVAKGGITSIFGPPGEPNAYPITTMRAVAAGASVIFGPTADGFCPTKATYRWKASSRTLAFKVVSEDCSVRRALLTAGTWRRK